MHFHGLHVSPTGNSDNVLLNIAPQTHFEYEVNIPFDHPSGTFWYHPHRHGSTAMQVASGASGPLIVRGSRRYAGGAPGDIDTILVKSLKKDPAQRYPSVLAFAGDLKRHLKREPITARPDTMAYRAAKFVRRNRTAVALATIALIAVSAPGRVPSRNAFIACTR